MSDTEPIACEMNFAHECFSILTRVRCAARVRLTEHMNLHKLFGRGTGMSTVTGTATQITGIAPQFLVDDLDRAIAFYCDKLGFSLDFKYEDFYASVSRDGFAIHLKHAAKLTAERAHQKQNEHLDAYIAVSGVRGLFAEFETRGAEVLKPLEERPWACVDFYVEDPDRYILCFSEQNA